jgi:hypothetical protein
VQQQHRLLSTYSAGYNGHLVEIAACLLRGFAAVQQQEELAELSL